MEKIPHDDIREVWAITMANARRIILRKKRTSNGRLFMELFGTGMGTARARCRLIGLDPDSNNTSYSEMIDSMSTQPPKDAE